MLLHISRAPEIGSCKICIGPHRTECSSGVGQNRIMANVSLARLILLARRDALIRQCVPQKAWELHVTLRHFTNEDLIYFAVSQVKQLPMIQGNSVFLEPLLVLH